MPHWHVHEVILHSPSVTHLATYSQSLAYTGIYFFIDFAPKTSMVAAF